MQEKTDELKRQPTQGGEVNPPDASGTLTSSAEEGGADEGEADRGGADGKSKALGGKGLGDYGRPNKSRDENG